MNAPQPFRLAAGGQVDRDRPIQFTCNNRICTGFAGDTVASALLANGVRVVGRSFKRHRPRGILSAGIEETNALFRVDAGRTSIPLVRATLQPLVAGLVATTENAYPNVDFDLGRILDYTHALWPAGFYNKTFKWPSWQWYENAIRHSAGLGRLPEGEDATQYFQHNLHCEVLVVGGGAAGIGAALAAARSGVRVVLLEQDDRLGGRLLAEKLEIDGAPAVRWLESMQAELARLPNLRILTSTMAAGCYDHGVVTAVDRSQAHVAASPVERFWKLRTKQIVLATGAIEQPLVFANNDRPGILLAGAVRDYLHRYAVTPGRSVVVATNNDDAYHTAFALCDAGVAVPAIVDARAQAGEAVSDEARRRKLTVVADAMVVDSAGTRGVQRVSVGALTPDGRGLAGPVRSIGCDAVAMSGGWSPSVHLYSQAGGKLCYDEGLACFVPDTCRAAVRVAGAANGDFALGDAITRGAAAGAVAARAAGATAVPTPMAIGATSPWSYGIRRLARAPGGHSGSQWVDFLHDVVAADIELAVRENFVAAEHLKRYTTAGMSIDQGKTSNLNALMLLADLTGRSVPEVGTTTFRPPYSPVAMGTLAGGVHGNLYAPARLMPGHDWHIAQGGELEDYGAWRRVACYPRSGESREQAIIREVHTVRNNIGLFEGSPLGKIEVRGPDAAEFLNRIYVNNALTLKPGKVRYGIMLSENGIVIDDGVFACLDPVHFLVNTTSGGADRIAGWLDEWHQCEWPDLKVVLMPVTTQWAVVSVVGPRARELLKRLESDIDFEAQAFPHMSIRTGQLTGLTARVQRVSFTGELSYEVSVPARHGEALCKRLFAAGTDLGIEPVGVEAWMVLRTEKGFLHVGGDTDGTTNPFDIGFGRIIDNKAGDFVGRRSLQRAHDRRQDRRQFVGLEPVNPDDRLVAGAHLVSGQGGKRRTEGFVTSACLSPTLGRSVGLGLLEGGFGRKGSIVTVFDNGRTLAARVVEPTFHDPAGERMNG